MDEFSLGSMLIALVVILICSGFFSAAETSMMALNRIRLNHLVRKGNKSAKLTARLLTHTDQLLGSMLFGNTLLNAAAASLTGIIILRLFGANDWLLLAGTLGISFILLVFSEIMPKIIAASHERPGDEHAATGKSHYPQRQAGPGQRTGFLGWFRSGPAPRRPDAAPRRRR